MHDRETISVHACKRGIIDGRLQDEMRNSYISCRIALGHPKYETAEVVGSSEGSMESASATVGTGEWGAVVRDRIIRMRWRLTGFLMGPNFPKTRFLLFLVAIGLPYRIIGVSQKAVNDLLKFFAEGAFSIINVAAPVFPKVPTLPPAAYHVQSATDMKRAFDQLKHEEENKSGESIECGSNAKAGA